jgi:hypothetical protein
MTAGGRHLHVEVTGILPVLAVGDLGVVEALAAVVATGVHNDLAADAPRFVAAMPVS